MKYLFIILFSIISLGVFAQENFEPACMAQPNNVDSVFRLVEQMPRYPDGEAEMMKFIDNHLKYSPTNDSDYLNTIAVVRFVVTKTGKIKNIQVLKGDNSKFAESAVNVIQQMPDWIPGQQNGESVDVYYVIPIRVCLRK